MATDKLRFFLSAPSAPNPVYIAWFHLQDDDLYWGMSGPSIDSTISSTIEGASMTIEVPENLQTSPTATWHASLHASGRRHVNADGSGALSIADAQIGDVRTLGKPFLLGALLIKPPVGWKEYTGRLDKGSGKFLQVDIGLENWNSRVYLEFYISPNVDVDPPEPILRGLSQGGLWISAPLHDSGKTILSCRVSPVSGAIGDWRPDATIIVLPDRNGEAATGSTDPE